MSRQLGLSPGALLAAIAPQVGGEPAAFSGVLKLPDVLLSDEEDVGELVDGTELELLPAAS